MVVNSWQSRETEHQRFEVIYVGTQRMDELPKAIE
jgi:hypothetical protein